MALPHLKPVYSARPMTIIESNMVTRRNKENDFREKWDHASNYFAQNNTAANKKASWESRKSFQSSMDAYKAIQDKDSRANLLQARRQRLSAMLAEEREQLHAELRELSGDKSDLLFEQKEKCDRLRSAREEKRKQIAEEKLYEHWRVNSPDIRKLESSRQTKFVTENWSMQLQEQREREERERLEREAIEQRMEEERRLAIEEQQRREEEKRLEALRMKMTLQDQMRELREREAEAKRLKEQEDMLLQEKWELAELEEQRKAQEKERSKVEFRQVLLRQHAAALRRRSQQIQKELEADYALLARLAIQEKEDQHIQSARREKARADAAWMKQVIEEQMKVEKAREAELDMLYQDEAARIWQQRESEWERERLARQRLMEEVMKTREAQIQEKMEETRRQQQESIERREQLLEELDLVNQLTQREVKEVDQKKLLRKQELQEQMTSRRDVRADEDMRLRLELEEEKMAEEDYNEMLRREAEQMSVRDFEPKSYRRKQAWT